MGQSGKSKLLIAINNVCNAPSVSFSNFKNLNLIEGKFFIKISSNL